MSPATILATAILLLLLGVLWVESDVIPIRL
jgi:hypothetical protein